LGKRLVNSQKSFRSQDIDEVGDNRHTTFFEMLGNWSLGDYFKKEQLAWFLEFLTKELGLPVEKLAVSVFEGNKNVPKDEESALIWQKLGIPKGRIFYYGVEKNWWSRSGVPDKMPPGEPGGPDSEVFFEFTDVLHDPKFGKICHPNCDCGRYLEIGNSVFMQYQKQADGTLKELTNKNVDFGGGLERLVAATENKSDIFQTDLFWPIIKYLEDITNLTYANYSTPMRIIADHIRASTFLISNGAYPSNKKQGYVVRRLLRRAAIKMRNLNINSALSPIFEYLSKIVINMYKDLYFSNSDEKEIQQQIGVEIFKFSDTVEKRLDKALLQLDKYFKQIDSKGGYIPANEKDLALFAFNNYQTYGIPEDYLYEEMKNKYGFILKMGYFDSIKFHAEFEKLKEKHSEKSRTSSAGMFKGGLQNQSEATIKLHTATHLLQQALRMILGTHVRQKGSHITNERLRFDFSHNQKLSVTEIGKIEALVNEKIGENLPISMKIIPLNEAITKGALTVPEAKYPEKVKVYSIGSFSKEVCGGPHVDFTGALGKFKIIKEDAAGSNIRRIYAVLL